MSSSIRKVAGTDGKSSIYPGKVVIDAACFELPVDGVKTLELTIPKAKLEVNEDFVFKIPVSGISRGR